MLRTPALGRALWYTVILTALVTASVVYTLNWSHKTGSKIFRPSGAWHGRPSSSEQGNLDAEKEKEKENIELPAGLHPITHLLRTAEDQFASLLKTETTTLEDAAAAYRKKRGRHPPPGFADWYTYATNSSAVVVESFWDQIYEDLKPFWSIDPVLLRKQTHVFHPKISVKEGKVRVSTHGAYEKLDIFADMLKTLARDVSVLGFVLPDIDIPLNGNGNEEPAMLIPWDTLDTLTSLFSPLPLLNPTDVVSEYTGMQGIDALTRNYTFDPQWLGPRLTHPSSHLGPRPLWSLVRPACEPDSAARKEAVYNDILAPGGGTEEGHEAAALLPVELPGGKNRVKGYIRWEDVIDVCEQPHLQGLHSAFLSPTSMSITQTLFPLFSATKLAVSNEILIPDLSDWTTTSSSSTSETGEPPVPWEEKSNKLHWRGTATLARDPSHYWRRFQLERLVSMLNATHVEIAEASIHSGNESTVGVGLAGNFRILPANEYKLESLTNGEMAEWVNSWGDAAFTSLDCVGAEGEGEGGEGCGEYFSIKNASTSTSISSPEENRNAKFAIILDSSSSSSSLPETLQSGKVTLRASIFRQWYDARLLPWLHYIPLDNTLLDLYGVMEYFIGSGVSEEAKEFSHAVGEVQGHGHPFQTPGINDEKEDEGEGHEHAFETGISPEPSAAEEEDRGMTGNEPHDFAKTHAKMRKRELDDHDEVARKIAEASKAWAEKVLRREDMLVYTYRLLLEYARIIDERRERLGWVDDLVSH